MFVDVKLHNKLTWLVKKEMSNQALSFIGRLDRREESLVMNQLQEKRFIGQLMGNRGGQLVHKLFGTKRVRDVYVPPRVTDGSAVVMPKN